MNPTPPSRGRALSGKVALITGGSRGIGLAIAEAVIAEGGRAVITGRTKNTLDEAGDRLGAEALAVEADVRDPESIRAAVDRAASHFGGLDVLVNNAGVGGFAPAGEMAVEEWRRVIDTNLSGVFYSCHAALPHLRRRGGGYIINISSLAGKNPFPGGTAYCASKAGLNAFSEALMQEVRYDNIRVTYVMPGSVATGFSGRGGDTAEWKIQPEDVGRVVLDLLLMPARSLPSRIELRPSQPPRKS